MTGVNWSTRSRGSRRREPSASADRQHGRGRRPRASAAPGRRGGGDGADRLADPTVGQLKRCRLPPDFDPSLRKLLVRTARVGAMCHGVVRVYASPLNVGGRARTGDHYVERAVGADRTILDEFLTTALEQLNAIRDENMAVLEGQVAPRAVEVRAAKLASMGIIDGDWAR